MVRHLPRSASRAPARRRTLVALAVTGVMLGCAALPAVGKDLDTQREGVQSDIEKAHDHLEESSLEVQVATNALLQARSDLAEAQAELARTQGELAAAQALDRQMQLQLDAAMQRLNRARSALAAGHDDMATQQRQLTQMVVASYEQGDPALLGLSMVFTTQDPAQLAGKLNANTTAVNIESTILDQLEATKVLLIVTEKQMKAAKAEVAEKRREAAENLQLMEALEEQARDAEEQVSEMVGLRGQARANALEARDADMAAIARLKAERDRIEALIREQARVSTSSSSSYRGRVGSSDGFLSMPVEGSVTSGYGMRIHPIWGYRSLHDGIDFGAACGTPIRAGAAGKVISEYHQTAWGNRIIIDHGIHSGVGLATIANHLSSYAVSEGDRVSRGQIIGYVGSTGWSTGCHLHYSVLENGVAVDPMRWH